jgi:hypothetical protein
VEKQQKHSTNAGQYPNHGTTAISITISVMSVAYPPENAENNYGMVLRSLFLNGLPVACNVDRMKGEVANYKA